ncbi:cilia-and flagella-associated protein 36 [Trichonephila inaurata madagascariensis]|uniref:Cilia- and flagella-associated protein 36 n=1 Tax=Trichonephila inaurata madagascariensis TaxID=2747483 RepID=A0A8X6XY56_9ARAC|nr:cilia-and flagella-associated protein 36 [Trichonephila inaurata madagascariensis]
MLGSYMEDLRITPEEFEKSCSVASKKALNQFHQSLFQQVWAADDFEIFRRMMTQKNLELQLQALEFLTQKRGSVPNCMEPNNDMKDEERSMEEIIKKAIEDVSQDFETEESNKITPADAALQEKMKLEAQKEKELLEQAIKQSVKEKEEKNKVENEQTEVKAEQSPTESEEPEDKENVLNGTSDEPTVESKTEELTEESKAEEPTDETKTEKLSDTKNEESNDSAGDTDSTQTLPEAPKLSLHSSLPPIEQAKTIVKTLPPLKTEPSLEQERPWSEGDATVYEQPQVEVTPMELEKRQNYLRQQRDRILAMKKQERARRLSNTEEVITQARPKSARAARKVLREEDTEVDPQTLAFRKTLAAKLRSEVIGNISQELRSILNFLQLIES